jgi:hypothetical protein
MPLLTEEHARSKRCPLPMGVMHDPSVQHHCIASDCMAWRFRQERARTEVPSTLHNYTNVTHDPPPGEDWVDTKDPNRDNSSGMSIRYWCRTTRGHCGAFGEPENFT